MQHLYLYAFGFCLGRAVVNALYTVRARNDGTVQSTVLVTPLVSIRESPMYPSSLAI